MAIIHLKNEKKIVIYCDICFNDITELTRSKCTVCFYDMCLICFFSTFTTKNHPTEHNYQIIEPLQKISQDNWTAFEEILLFDAINLFGIGNWEDISDFVGKSDIAEVEKHFYNQSNIETKQKSKKESNNQMPKTSNPNRHEVASFMPLRKDFDTEYENDFENIIREMRDDPIFENGGNQRLKDALLGSYNNLMRIRNVRKYAILEKNLISMKDTQANLSKLKASKYHAPFVELMKPLSMLLTKSDINKFLQGLVIERFLEEKLTLTNNASLESDDYLQTERKMSLLLTESEKQLCFKMQINFKKYLQMKDIILTHYFKYGSLDLCRLRVILGSNDERIADVYDFFKENKWIS